MEKEKRRYMSYFFDRLVNSSKEKGQIICESSDNSGHIWARNTCTKVVSELEEEARAFYAEDINLDKDHLVAMLLLDACFMLELFHRCLLISVPNNNDQSLPLDPLAGSFPMVQALRNDLMLLENQIPYVVLQKLFDLVPDLKKVSIGTPDMSLEGHIFCFFNSVPMLQHKILNFKDGSYRHLLDMLYHDCCFSNTSKSPPSMISPHSKNNKNWGLTKCATELYKSGVRLVCDQNRAVVDIRYNEGEISIPQVIIGKSSDTVFRNLIALEQTSTGGHSVTSYVKIMSTLIRSPKDADLLEQLGIIKKSDGETDASAFFERLCRGVVFVDFCYTDLCKEVNDYHLPVWKWRRLKGYYRIKYVEWKESTKDMMNRDHFQNRWHPLKFLATSILILLAFLQTFYTIRAYYHPA
nr:PREDICTED: UPF0481 protein At3g47200-like [Daucus carota subsp. sativus]